MKSISASQVVDNGVIYVYPRGFSAAISKTRSNLYNQNVQPELIKTSHGLGYIKI